MNTFLHVCGVDVSKSSLDYYHSDFDKTRVEKISNTLESIQSEFILPKYDDCLFVLEYTGNYSAKLVHKLAELGRPFSVVNPYQSKSFMAALGMTNKTDKNAAYSLSLMGAHLSLPLYQIPSEQMQARKQVLNTLNALEKQERMLKNQIHALEQLAVISDTALEALKQVLQSVETQMLPLQEQLNESIDDARFEQVYKYVISVKGIGNKTAQALLLATNSFEGFEDASKVAKFLGLTPSSHYSGSSVKKKGKITKFGNSTVRSLLFNCTRSAIRYNKPCKELFQRLRADGKPYKVAAVAVMHKLVKQAFACANKKVLFDNEYHLKNN